MSGRYSNTDVYLGIGFVFYLLAFAVGICLGGILSDASFERGCKVRCEQDGSKTFHSMDEKEGCLCTDAVTAPGTKTK